MTQRTFRLAGVLRLRRLEEELARARLGDAQRSIARADVAATRRLSELRAGESAVGAGDARSFLAASDRCRRQADAVRAAWAAARTARELHAQRSAELVGASMRVAALERLEERVGEERLELERQAEQRELDDLVTTRYRRGEP